MDLRENTEDSEFESILNYLSYWREEILRTCVNKFGQDHYVTGSGLTLTIYKDEIVRQFSLLANRTVRWSAYMENLLLIPQQTMDQNPSCNFFCTEDEG